MGKGFEVNELGTTVWEGTPVIAHLTAAGVLPFITETVTNDENRFEGYAKLELIQLLRAHPKFKSGAWHKLHKDVGKDRIEFRSFKGELVPEINKSCQIVMDKKTGKIYADLDDWNPYEDVVSLVGHNVFEVLVHKLRWW